MRSGCLELALAIESPLGYPLGSPPVLRPICGPLGVLHRVVFQVACRPPARRAPVSLAALAYRWVSLALRSLPLVWSRVSPRRGWEGWWGWTARAVKLELRVLEIEACTPHPLIALPAPSLGYPRFGYFAPRYDAGWPGASLVCAWPVGWGRVLGRPRSN